MPSFSASWFKSDNSTVLLTRGTPRDARYACASSTSEALNPTTPTAEHKPRSLALAAPSSKAFVPPGYRKRFDTCVKEEEQAHNRIVLTKGNKREQLSVKD